MVKHFFFSLPSVKNPKFFKEDLEQMLFRSKRRSITGISGRASVTRSELTTYKLREENILPY